MKKIILIILPVIFAALTGFSQKKNIKIQKFNPKNNILGTAVGPFSTKFLTTTTQTEIKLITIRNHLMEHGKTF